MNRQALSPAARTSRTGRLPALFCAGLFALALSACETGRYTRRGEGFPSPERVYTLVASGGGSDEVRVRCPGAFTTRIEGLSRKRVHCVWEFRKSTDEPLRFDPATVRLEDPAGRSFGPSEVRVNGQSDAALDLSHAGAAFVDLFFDLGDDYRLRNLDVLTVQWSLDLGNTVKDFTTRFYQEPRYGRDDYFRSSHLGLSVGYSGGWHHHPSWYGGVSHGVWFR